MIVIVFLLLLDLSPGLNFLICVILSLSPDWKSIKTVLLLEESLVWVRGPKENNNRMVGDNSNKAKWGASNPCPACNKNVYPSEQVFGADRKPWHRQCIRCSVMGCPWVSDIRYIFIGYIVKPNCQSPIPTRHDTCHIHWYQIHPHHQPLSAPL